MSWKLFRILEWFNLFLLLFLFDGLIQTACGQEVNAKSKLSSKLTFLQDSLDKIHYSIPKMPLCHSSKRIVIKTQKQWNSLANTISEELNHGVRDIEVAVEGKDLILIKQPQPISGLNFPDANVHIVGNKARMIPDGLLFMKSDYTVVKEGNFWSKPYNEFDVNDLIVDKKGNEIPLRGEVLQTPEDIIPAKEAGEDVWRIKVDVPDLQESECNDFYILLTRDWISARHKVVKVQNGWLFFHLDSKDLHSSRNPNVDWIQYGVRPRYCLINNPVSDKIHVKNDRLYVPNEYAEVRISKGGMLLHMGACKFNSFEVSGFNINGLGNRPAIGVYHCIFSLGMYIHHNQFSNMSTSAVSSDCNVNMIISDNTITNTRIQAIECGGENNTVCRNSLKNIGWMLNTRAIIGGGNRLHICDNLIEDFNYSAIAVGSRAANRDSVKLTYIIERNIIRLTRDYTDNYIQNTLADGGGIYIGPQCQQGIIRNNVVENIKGIHSNRGIFLDDGAKNLAIYGNLIMNTDNSYDVDLRLSNSLAKDIPDYNTNNVVFHNIMTGGYRFQDKGKKSNCIGGQNLLLGLGRTQNIMVGISESFSDWQINDAKHLRNHIQIDNSYKGMISQMGLSTFVRQYIKFK